MVGAGYRAGPRASDDRVAVSRALKELGSGARFP